MDYKQDFLLREGVFEGIRSTDRCETDSITLETLVQELEFSPEAYLLKCNEVREGYQNDDAVECGSALSSLAVSLSDIRKKFGPKKFNIPFLTEYIAQNSIPRICYDLMSSQTYTQTTRSAIHFVTVLSSFENELSELLDEFYFYDRIVSVLCFSLFDDDSEDRYVYELIAVALINLSMKVPSFDENFSSFTSNFQSLTSKLLTAMISPDKIAKIYFGAVYHGSKAVLTIPIFSLIISFLSDNIATSSLKTTVNLVSTAIKRNPNLIPVVISFQLIQRLWECVSNPTDDISRTEFLSIESVLLSMTALVVHHCTDHETQSILLSILPELCKYYFASEDSSVHSAFLQFLSALEGVQLDSQIAVLGGATQVFNQLMDDVETGTMDTKRWSVIALKNICSSRSDFHRWMCASHYLSKLRDAMLSDNDDLNLELIDLIDKLGERCVKKGTINEFSQLLLENGVVESLQYIREYSQSLSIKADRLLHSIEEHCNTV